MSTCAGVCGAIKNYLVYNTATLALKPLNDGACAVVAGSLFHNLTVPVSRFERVSGLRV